MDLKIIHLNIRSLPRNGDTFIAYLDILKLQFDIICLSETWMNQNREIENQFPDYNQFHSMRSPDQPPGGGVSVFVHKRLNSAELSHLSCNITHIECVFVEIILSNRKVTIGCCYRKPDASTAHLFITDLTAKITSIGRNSEIIVAGDFNFNLLQLDLDPTASMFLDSMLSLGLLNTITKPTRNLNNSISLLDNIFISSSIPFSSGLFCWDISDHYAVFAVLRGMLSTQNQSEYIKYRLITEHTINNLRNALAVYDFTHILQSDNLDVAMHDFYKLVLTEFNNHCPILTKKITKRDRQKPWINNFIKQLINTRQFFYNLYVTNEITFESYKRFRNFVTNKIKESKYDYFDNLLKQVKNNMKKIWTVINGLIKPNYNRNERLIKSLLIDGEIFEDDCTISNLMNQHFATIGSKISEQFTDNEHRISSRENVTNSLFFRSVLPGDVLRIIDGMKNKPSGIHTYPVKILKELKFIIAPILASIINKSLQLGQFPAILKIARVVPLHKGGCRSDINNYRPISVLSLFSKIFERIVYNQLYAFLEKYDILSPNQYGFRKNRSTTEAVIQQLEFIYQNLDQNKTVVSIFMDFSKAFDCIDHRLLLRKLYFYGIRGLPYLWFESYLSGRTQYVSVNNTNSSKLPVSHGVPQGSVLGPLLFLIFINDFPNVSQFFKFCIFADDSTLTSKFDSSDETIIRNKLETELQIVYHWLTMNKIKINYTKSKFIIFSYGKKFTLDQIRFGENFISSTDSTKFLGIMIDNHLNFKSHVDMISLKISKIVGLLFRMNNILPKETLKSLYCALLLPYILYGIEIWYGVKQYNNDRIFKLQKKAIRAVNSLPYNTHTNDYFKTIQLLKVEDIYKQQVLLYMFKFCTMPTQADNHDHFTRNRHNLIIPRFYRATTQATLFYRGILLWNNLPENIKSLPFRGAFKNSVKQMMIEEY